LSPRFFDVRKEPISPKETLALVRKHARVVAKKGTKLYDLKTAEADDATLLKLFLGREGTLRAPTVSDGHTILGGYDEATLKAMLK
jgi:hypothetical protein